MTATDLALKLSDQPFRPFRLKMVNNTTYDVWEPWMIVIGESSAVVVTQTRQDDRELHIATEWRTISINHVLEIQDLEAKPRQKRRPA